MDELISEKPKPRITFYGVGQDGAMKNTPGQERCYDSRCGNDATQAVVIRAFFPFATVGTSYIPSISEVHDSLNGYHVPEALTFGMDTSRGRVGKVDSCDACSANLDKRLNDMRH